MPKLFGVDIAGIVHKSMSPGLPQVVLIKVTKGTRTAGSLRGGTNPTTTEHGARGFLAEYDDRAIDGTLVKAGDRQAVLIGNSIAGGQVPTQGDRVRAEGVELEIVRVKRDPAAATYTCQCRAF